MSDKDLAERLRCCDITGVCDVPFKDLVIPAKLVKVIDGDTIKVVILLGTHPLSIKVRLAGIDAPETSLKGKTTQLEKDAGLVVKKYVGDLLAKSEIIYIKLTQIDKYGGRYVGHAYRTERCVKKNNCISQQLLSLKYAKSYDGGKKALWEATELKYIVDKTS